MNTTKKQGASLREAAEAFGCVPSMVHKHKAAGRLVLFEDGSIDIEASRDRIFQHVDPVHGGRRGQSAALSTDATTPHTSGPSGGSPTPLVAPSLGGPRRISGGFADAKERKELALAVRAELMNGLLVKQLGRVEDFRQVYVDDVMSVVSRLERLPRQVSRAMSDLTEEQRRELERVIEAKCDAIRRERNGEPPDVA